MKAKNFAIALLATSLAVAPIVHSTRTLGQNQTTAKGQKAIEIAAKVLQVPAGELKVTSEVKIDGGITKIKVLHASTARIAGFSLDESNNEVTQDRVREVAAKKQGQDFVGKLEKDLAARVRNTEAAKGTTDVVIWGKTPAKVLARPTNAEGKESSTEIASLRNYHRNATQSLRKYIEASGGKIKYQAEFAPLLVVSVPNNSIAAIEQRGDVQTIQLERQYQRELSVSAKAVDADKVWSRSITGSGVKVAVVEDDAIYFGHSKLADGSYCNTLANSPIDSHATGVAGIIASTDSSNKGVAFGAPAVLSGNAKNYSDAEIIKCTEWAINNGAKVINYSFGVSSGNTLVALDRYVDYVIRNRAVTIVKSAGNIGGTCFSPQFNISSPGKGWNILTVGNYNDKGTASNSDDEMSSTSCYGDPTSTHGDRQKPEVAAPGTNITTTYCTGPSDCFGTASGTSFSAPHVVGCAALLMQRNTALQYWPESIKAIFMASAVTNIEGDSRLSNKDGAGGVECDSADDIVRGAAGVEAHGSFTKSNFPKTYTFNAKQGDTVRVAIAWDSTTDLASPPATDVLKADFDLTVTCGAAVASSTSFDNSYEIAQLTAPATGTCTAKVTAHRFDGNSEFLGFAAWAGQREK